MYRVWVGWPQQSHLSGRTSRVSELRQADGEHERLLRTARQRLLLAGLVSGVLGLRERDSRLVLDQGQGNGPPSTTRVTGLATRDSGWSTGTAGDRRRSEPGRCAARRVRRVWRRHLLVV